MHTQILPLIQRLAEKENILPLSYSKVRLLLACPRQFKLRYLDKAEGGIALDKESAVVGKFLHAVLQYCLDKGQHFGYTEDTVDYDLTWMQVAKQAGLTSKEYDMAQDMRMCTENVLSRVLSAVRSHELQVITEANLVMRLDGEVRSNARWPDRFFTGIADFLGLSKNKSRALIIDYKSHPYSEERRRDEEIQTGIYALLTFLRFPTVRTIQAGCAYLPEEKVDLFATYHRDDPKLVVLVVDFLTEFLEKLESTCFAPEASKFCDWCTYSAGCSAFKGKAKNKKT